MNRDASMNYKDSAFPSWNRQSVAEPQITPAFGERVPVYVPCSKAPQIRSKYTL